MYKLMMEIDGYNSIDNAEIEINKINVVGGVNGSGKSTASKILYSFLKGNSNKRREYALQFIADSINMVIDELDYEGNDYGLPEHLHADDEDSVFYDKYASMLEISERHDELAKVKTKELEIKISDKINLITQKLEEMGFDLDELQFGDYLLGNVIILGFFIDENNLDEFKDDLEEIKELNDEYEYFHNSHDAHISCAIYNKLMNNLFVEDTYYLSRGSEIYVRNKEFIGNVGVDDAHFYMKSNDERFNPYSYFFTNGFIDSIYYVDNVSIFDLLTAEGMGLGRLFHMDEIIEDLFEGNDDGECDDDVKVILDRIESIIKGKYSNDFPIFETNIKDERDILGRRLKPDEVEGSSFLRKIYGSERKVSTFNFNTPSGIKQIGVVQLLLLNNRLKRGGYLIIDEPEVNLHPEWQIRFAEILVLLSKELDITLYLNSHSPMFIEAVSLYSQYHGLIDETSVYLTQESGNDKYVFKRIDPHDMGAVYENLTKPYDELDRLKAKILFKG